MGTLGVCFFFSSRRRHTRWTGDWSSDVCSSDLDVAMLRRSWGALIDHLGQLRQPILRAVLESATVASFDGETLELAFPPDKRFGVQKVQDRQDDLLLALGDLFGIAPR